MRSKKMAFLCCAIVAAMGLLASPRRWRRATSCSFAASSVGRSRTLSGDSAPTPRACQPAGSRDRATPGSSTASRGSPDYIATLVTANNTVVSSGTALRRLRGRPGDRASASTPATSRPSPSAATTPRPAFWIVVEGQKAGDPAIGGHQEGLLRQVLSRRRPWVRRQSLPGHAEDRDRQLQGLRGQVHVRRRDGCGHERRAGSRPVHQARLRTLARTADGAAAPSTRRGRRASSSSRWTVRLSAPGSSERATSPAERTPARRA